MRTSDKGARWRWISKAPVREKDGSIKQEDGKDKWVSRTYERPKTGTEIKGKQAIKLAKKQRRLQREAENHNI